MKAKPNWFLSASAGVRHHRPLVMLITALLAQVRIMSGTMADGRGMIMYEIMSGLRVIGSVCRRLLVMIEIIGIIEVVIEMSHRVMLMGIIKSAGKLYRSQLPPSLDGGK